MKSRDIVAIFNVNLIENGERDGWLHSIETSFSFPFSTVALLFYFYNPDNSNFILHVISNNRTSLPVHTTLFECPFHKSTTLRAQTTLSFQSRKNKPAPSFSFFNVFAFIAFYFSSSGYSSVLRIHRRCEGALISCSNKCCFEKRN